MRDEADLEADLLAFELLEAFVLGPGNDHVIAVRVVVDEDHHALAAGRAGDQRVTVRHRHCIELARRKGVHRRHVVEPLERRVDARFLQPAFVDCDLPRDPARPIAVSDPQWCGRSGCGRGVCGTQPHDERGGEAQQETEGSLGDAHFILRAVGQR